MPEAAIAKYRQPQAGECDINGSFRSGNCGVMDAKSEAVAMQCGSQGALAWIVPAKCAGHPATDGIGRRFHWINGL